MSPRFTPYYRANVSVVNREHISQSLLGKSSTRILVTDFHNLGLGQLCPATPLSKRCDFSSLLHHVVNILLLCSGSQVSGIAALWCGDARVENTHSLRHVRFIFRNPSESVGPDGGPNPKVTHCEGPIPACDSTPLPQPALISALDLNFGPESFLASVREKLRHQFRGDILCSHNSDSLICATAPAVSAARGHFCFNQ